VRILPGLMESGPLDGGTLYTQFSHYIDTMRWLFGDIKTVSWLTKDFAHQGVIESEDSGVAVIETEAGICGGLKLVGKQFSKKHGNIVDRDCPERDDQDRW